MEQRKPISTLKNLSGRGYDFQKLTSFSHGDNVIDAPVSDTNDFLLRETCVSSPQLIRPISNKQSLSPPSKTYIVGSIPFKNQLNSHRETMCYILLLLTQVVFLGDIHIFLPPSLIVLFRTKKAYLHLEKPKLQELFLSKTNTILTGKQCNMLLLVTQMVFFLEILVFLQLR